MTICMTCQGTGMAPAQFRNHQTSRIKIDAVRQMDVEGKGEMSVVAYSDNWTKRWLLNAKLDMNDGMRVGNLLSKIEASGTIDPKHWTLSNRRERHKAQNRERVFE